MAFARLLSFAVSTVAGAGLWFAGTESIGRALFFLAMFLASSALFAIRPIRLASGPDSARLAPCLPVLSAFALGGSWGFALASFLAGLGVLLAAPVSGIFSPPSMPVRKRPAFRLLLGTALLSGFGILAFLGPLSPAFILAAFILSLGTFALSLWGSLDRDPEIGGRRSFLPVPILGREGPPLNFAWAMLPFALVSMALAFRLLLPTFADKRLPELACALSPMLFVLPAFLAWGTRSRRKSEAGVKLFSVDRAGKDRKGFGAGRRR